MRSERKAGLLHGWVVDGFAIAHLISSIHCLRHPEVPLAPASPAALTATVVDDNAVNMLGL